MPRLSVAVLTDAVTEAMKPGFLWDSEVRGFYARRRVPGGPVRFGIKYRYRGETVWQTFEGDHWTVSAARREAGIRMGADPTERRELAAMPSLQTFSTVYIRDHLRARCRPATVEKVLPRIENKILPRFGKMKLDQIRTTDVHAWHASMAKTPVEANRALSLLRHILNAAELWGVVRWPRTPAGVNPTKGVKRFRESSRRVFLSTKQLGALGAALRKMETTGLQGMRYAAVVPNPGAANLFRLSLLTGARPGALKGLRHEWVDVAHAQIRIPDGKTGFQVIAMPPPAAQLYRRIPRIHGTPWVFPVRGLGHIVNIWDAWSRLRTEAKLGDVKPHDLRHTFASVAVAENETLYMVQTLLGHATPTTTQRYAHLASDPQQAAASRVADKITKALKPSRAKKPA